MSEFPGDEAATRDESREAADASGAQGVGGAASRETEAAPAEAGTAETPHEAEEAATDATPSNVESPAESAEDLVDPLTEAMNTISALEDKVARAHADVYNLQQEYNGFVRRSKADGVARREEGIAAVIETLLPVLDDAELARQHGDLEGPAGQIVEKIEQTLAVNYKVERFGAEGDDFDPQIHEALMHQTSPDVESEKVNVLIQPGYRIGDKLLRPARVGVVSPE